MKPSRSFLFRSSLAIFFVWLALGLTPPPKLYNRPGFSQAVFDRDGNLLRLTLSNDDKFRLWSALSEMPQSLIQATLTKEDRYFYYHYGFNPYSILKAFVKTYLLGQKMGGSTLSMQLARLRFGLNTRTIGGKLEQILRAVQLERHYSKSEILEAYLNLAPYGGNIEGAPAASWVYFGKRVSRLSEPEALALAVIPQNPSARSPTTAQKRKNLEGAKQSLIQKASLEGALGSYQNLLFSSKAELPYKAQHLVDRLVKDYPFAPEIHSSIDARAQNLLERIAARFVDKNRRLGINNAEALLVDTRSMQVSGYLGSADFFNASINGQVDGIRAKRSPGSALKPFIYGLAIDQGLITPDSVLKDTSFSISGYNPENFDRDFIGPISATDALIRSRNIPAIQLANSLKNPSLYDFLKQAKVSNLRDEGFYGLALALGGAEVSLEELVRMYAALKNDGVLKPLQFTTETTQTWATSLLSPEASYLVLEMLRQNPAPHEDFDSNIEKIKGIPWKTGTSFGFRDAWAVGLVGPYALGVWIGNFDGTPNPNFVGRDAAGPLFFQIASALRNEMGALETPRLSPLNIKRVKLCALSGELPGAHCQHLKDGWFIPGVSPIKVCSVHREVLIDIQSGLRACEASASVTPRVFEFWPSDILKVFKAAGIYTKTAPAFDAKCVRRVARGSAPLIASPQASLTYSITDQLSASASQNKIPFSAVTDGEAREVYWFVSNDFVGKSSSGETFFWPARPGNFTVIAVDDQGRNNSQKLKVELRQHYG